MHHRLLYIYLFIFLACLLIFLFVFRGNKTKPQSPSIGTIAPTEKINIQKTNILKVLNIEPNNKATVAIFVDDRSSIALENTIHLFKYFRSIPIELNINLLFVNRKKTSKILADIKPTDISLFSNIDILSNFLYIFDSQGAYSRSIRLTNNIKTLLTEIDDHLGIPSNSTLIQSEFVPGRKIFDTFLASITKRSFVKNYYNCYFIHNEICPGCKSGAFLLECNNIQNISSEYKCHFIVFNEYPFSEIDAYRKEYKIDIDIIVPNNKDILLWRNHETDLMRMHPLIGMIMLVAPDGSIILVTKSSDALIDMIGKLRQQKGGMK